MYSEWYANISSTFRAKPNAARTLDALDKGLVAIIAIAYVAEIVAMLASSDARIVKFVAVPAIGLAIETAVRAAINAPRPYEKFDIDPIISKDTQGKSFPSRHIFSAAIIALAILWVNGVAGFIALVATAAVAFCRIVGGVHFPRDAVSAIGLAGLIGLAGFILIP